MSLDNIQWLTLLSLVACLLVIYVTERNRSKWEEESLGLGKGVVALLGQWIGLYAFLASSQVSYQYGIVGMVGYSAAGIVSFLFVYLWIDKEKKRRVQPPQLLSILYRLEGTLVALMAGKMILHLVYEVNTLLSIGIVTVFFWLILLIRFNKPNRTSFVIVILSMASTVLLPTLVYLKVSVPTVYSGVKFLATDMLRLDNTMSWVLTAALMIRFTSHSLVNPQIRTIYRQIKETRRGLSFSLAPLIWAFLPLSIGTLSFVAKAEAVWPVFADEVSILIVSHFGGQLGIVLFTVTLILILLVTMARYLSEGTEAAQATDLLTRALIILVSAFVALLFPHLTILDTMLVFALIWAAVTPAVLWGRELNGISALVTAAIGLGTGIYYTIHASLALGIIIDFAVSFSIMGLLSIFMKREKGGFRLE
ncbi:hypothetical protein EDM56_12150 [Brevibacillus fluminis]|uniref:Sodium:solute symporter n=1 Tax=Brevibacillus fluminis TaxID=511487 RepID=A0A3M8DP59_9BACL|nr:hypothetical protein [Brevibacillus fluminis]RNB89903.1 hypothetical protein EDM56_12150 [Brevibacillus fluminis]